MTLKFAIALISLGMASHCFSVEKTQPLPTQTELQQAYKAFQQDADIVRLQHLWYWVTAIEDYHKKVGKYPLQGKSDNPIYVFVASPRQQQYTQMPPAPATTETMEKFVATLESGLGKTIDEYYDPQFAPDAKPNFYMYMIDGENYYFAIHTHQKFLFSKPIRKDFHKVEVSNKYASGANLVLTSEFLFQSQPYQDAVRTPLKKESFFAEREALTLHATKLKNKTEQHTKAPNESEEAP